MRRLTTTEKNDARGLWPNMNVDNVLVSAEATATYNCLAWALGISTRWVWPWGSREPSKSEFDSYLRSQGHPPAESGPIAGFGSSSVMKHAVVSGVGHGTRWESKCGQWLRIQHGLGEMEGGGYGRTRGFYSESRVSTVREELMHDYLSNEETKYLQERVDAVPVSMVEEFERRYGAWKQSWTKFPTAISSCPGDYAKTKEFFAVLEMGDSILPLLMHRMLSPDDSFALQVVELLARAEVIYQFDIDDPDTLGGEQERAKRTVKHWVGLEA